MKSYLEIFNRSAAAARPLLASRQIETHVGCWHESAVLKLQKPRWTPTAPSAASTDTGIFFSIWVEAKSLKKKQAFYNIHALKLRSLDGFSIQSREFAAAFRSAFAASARNWPHVSTDHGPQTLMEGWIDLDLARLESDVTHLVCNFIPLAALIDTLLDQRMKSQ